jgi:transcriptional regulator with XRE-family HTH domain
MGIKSIFGANVKYYRKKINLSQEQLAEQVEITPKHLSTIETGTVFVSAALLERLTKKLEVSASALFYSVEETPIDDNLLFQINQIVDGELAKIAEEIKQKIHHEAVK